MADIGEGAVGNPSNAIQSIGGGWGPLIFHRMQDTDREVIEGYLGHAWEPVKSGVYPRRDQVFAALERTPLRTVRAVILGQDPYPDGNSACGLAFSVPRGVNRPRSLRRIVEKLEEDLGTAVDADATLEPWADHGVLLLNTALTFRVEEAVKNRALWRPFTQAVLEVLVNRDEPIVFLLWGAAAQNWSDLVHREPHAVFMAPHPASRWPKVDSRSFSASHPFRDTKDRVCWAL